MDVPNDDEILYAINDALGEIAGEWGLLDLWSVDESDTRLDDATHAAFNILKKPKDHA